MSRSLRRSASTAATEPAFIKDSSLRLAGPMKAEKEPSLAIMPQSFSQAKLMNQIEKRVYDQLRISSKFFENKNECQSEEHLAFQKKLWALLDPLAFLMEHHNQLGEGGISEPTNDLNDDIASLKSGSTQRQ